MKNQKVLKGFLLAAMLCLVSSILLANRLHAVADSQKGQTPQVDDPRMLVQVLRRDGLRGAAKLKGHYVTDFDPHWDFGAFDVESLTKNSAGVVVGMVGTSLGGHLTEDGLTILTDYPLIVQENIKGDFLKGSTITISLPGGSIQFEDGTTAELRTPTFEHVKAGGQYTIFLTEIQNSPGKYTLTGGPQGLVEILDDGSVKSHGRSTDPVAIQAKEKDKRSFLKKVREQATKWPNKGKCCT